MVGIICFWDRLATPYLAKYEKLLQSSGTDYEVVLWNRTPEEDMPQVTREGLLCKIHFEHTKAK